MAIIKFISGIECCLYIDTQFIEELHANVMLKVPLESGSYLVEIKDFENVTLKRYELIVNTTDTQILQDLQEKDKHEFMCLGRWFEYIGCDNKTILVKDDKRFFVISRKDFTIQNEYFDAGYDGLGQLIPVYKEIGFDDVYGYIDKTGQEIIPLIYDFAWNFENSGYAKVNRFGATHAVDLFGNLYKYMPHPDEVKGNVEMLSKEECFHRGFDVLGLYPVKEGNFWGLGCDERRINNGSDTNKIMLFKCDRILFFSGDFAQWFLAYKKGKVCNFVVQLVKDKEGDTYSFEADCIEPIVEAPNDCREVDRLIIKKNRKYGVVTIYGKMILPIEFDAVIPAMINEDDGWVWNVVNIGYIIKKDGKYGLVNYEAKTILPIEFELIADAGINRAMPIINNIKRQGNYFLLRNKGKYALFCLSSEEYLLPFEYEDITVLNPISGNSILLVKKKDKSSYYSFNEEGKIVEIVDVVLDNMAF